MRMRELFKSKEMLYPLSYKSEKEKICNSNHYFFLPIIRSHLLERTPVNICVLS